jgi:hypothetical protein
MNLSQVDSLWWIWPARSVSGRVLQKCYKSLTRMLRECYSASAKHSKTSYNTMNIAV